jgi:hypothetical protein
MSSGVGAGAIDGLLDRQHVRVFGRLADEVDHRLEGLEGVVQQQVAGADRLEQVRLLDRTRAAGPARRVGT